jgi:hypothetical protein
MHCQYLPSHASLPNLARGWLAWLDRAVWAAYGWDDADPAAVPEEEILARLLALNRQRAERQGQSAD